MAIALVLIFHLISHEGFYPSPASPYLGALLDSLWCGVDIFFVLSGFLIGGIILDHGASTNFYQVFYWRRALRIWPLALFTVAFAYFVVPLFNLTFLWASQTPPYAYVFLINNFWSAGGLHPYAPLAQMWSLAIEEQFYLLGPLSMLLAGPRTRAWALAAIVVVSPLLRSVEFRMAAWDFTPFRLDGLALGILVATAVRHEGCLMTLRSWRRGISCLSAALVVATLAFFASPLVTVQHRVAYGVSMASATAAAVLLHLYLNPHGRLSHCLSATWLVALGQMSYFIYLMHMPILACVATLELNASAIPPLALALCLIYAWASWRWPEAYLAHLGRRWRYKPA